MDNIFLNTTNFRDSEHGRDATEGNTASVAKSKGQSNQYKYWLFTFNNYQKLEDQFMSEIRDISIKGVVGKEVGASGTPHLQGFIELKKRARLSELKKFVCGNCHWESCRGNESQNVKYCSKDGNFVKWGFPNTVKKPIKVIETLRPWQDDILEIYKTEPDDRKIYWFWETEGNIGKSAFIKYMIVEHKVLFCSGGKHTDIMNLVFNQDMDDCKAVFFDIPRAHKGHISYASLESIKNGMVCNTKYETGVKIFNSPHLFVFANFPPENPDQLSNDRWHIHQL